MSHYSPHPIEVSLALAAERCGDMTPEVYARLFAEYPEMERLFVRDTNGSVKGEMLFRVFEVLLDLVGDNLYAANLIRCEVTTHAGYDVPRDVFPTFFRIVAETMRDELGTEWTPEFDSAWEKLLRDIDVLMVT
jgi:hemoglobin-like flavoprotein